MRRVRVAIIQTKPRKGKYAENLKAAGEAFAQINADGGAELIVLPEAAMTGYFLEGATHDLAVSAEQFARDLAATYCHPEQAAGRVEGRLSERSESKVLPTSIVCGFYENDGGTYYNSAMFLRIEGGKHEIVHLHRKMFLPTYGVFDEERFLSRGRRVQAFDTEFGRVAMLICEDVWHTIVPTVAAIKGARIIIVPSAAPGRGIDGVTELTSITRWREILSSIAAEHGVYLVYAGLAGFEGGKGMTGSSCVVDPRGTIVVQANATDACIVRAEIDLREIDLARANLPLLGDLGSALPDLFLDEELPLPRHMERGNPPSSRA